VIIGIDKTQRTNSSIEADDFIWEIVTRLAAGDDQQLFYVFCDISSIHSTVSKNIFLVPTAKAKASTILSKLCLKIKFRNLLKKYKVDLLIASQNSYYANTAQYLIVTDLDFILFPDYFSTHQRSFLLQKIKQAVQKAEFIVVKSLILKTEMIRLLEVQENKIVVVPSAPRTFVQPLNSQQKLLVKEKYTCGKEYFYYRAANENPTQITTLLKAFSLLKKRQQSNWKLVIASPTKINEILLQLQTYKYRDDVILNLIESDEIYSDLLAGAYATIDLAHSGLSLYNLESMKTGVPVLAYSAAGLGNIEAIQQIKSNDVADIADGLMLLYKDEVLRNELIEKEKVIASQYSWEQSAKIFGELILKQRSVNN